MSPRAIVVVVLAMSGSFVTILAVVGYLISGPAGGQHPGRRDVVTVAPPTLRAPETEDARRARGVFGADTAAQGPDVPAHSVPLSQTPDPGPLAADGDSEEPDLEHMSQVAQNRLQGVEAALNRQVRLLKKSRDEMIQEFAGHLAAMPASEATLALKALDDETAALTMKRLAPARRSAILRALPADRRAALQKRLNAAGR